MSNSDSNKNWEYELGAPVGSTSSVFLEMPAELLIKCQSEIDLSGKENDDIVNK